MFLSAATQRVAAIRRYLGMTQEQLAEALRGVGIDMERVVVAKLESGRRGFIRVDELLGLSVVLAVAPVDLMVSPTLHNDQPYLITPDLEARATNAREFIRGEDYLFVSKYAETEPVPEPQGKIRFVSPNVPIDPFQWMPADRANRLIKQQADMQEWINQEEERRFRDHQVQNQVPGDHQDHDSER